MTKKLLYLDIDGVLLGREKPGSFDVRLAKHAKDFLRFSLRHFECYWLTTHCKEGDVRGAIKWMKPYCDKEFLKLAKRVKPTTWRTLKTEAIDFTSDFYWLDNGPLQFEIDLLKEKDCLNRWINTDTWANPNGLEEARRVLKDK